VVIIRAEICKYIQIVSRLCPEWVLTVGGSGEQETRGLLSGVGQVGELCNHKKTLKK